MTLALVFLLNAALSFALSLVLAAILAPEGFGRYAIGLALATLLTACLFEWLRLSTTRFYSERVRQERPEVRATLDRAYLATALALAVAAVLVVAIGPALGLPGGASAALVAASFSCAIAYGSCDYRLALARARFLEAPYILIAFLRALFVAGLAAGAAWFWGDAPAVLAAGALGALVPVAVTRRRLADPGLAGRPGRDVLAGFARYGLPLVAAGALYQLLPLLNRMVLAGRAGFVEAGYFGLASELATRLFQNLGAALDLVLFQLVVRAEEETGHAAAARQVSRNAGLLAAILLPTAAGWWVVWPSFEAVFVPAAFRGQLEGTMGLMIPALACFALAQYAISAAFQLRRRTAPALVAAAVSFAVDAAMLLLWPGALGPEHAAGAQLAGLATGLLVLAALAVAGGLRLPWRDLGGAAAATALMLAALWRSRDAAPSAFVLALQVGAGLLVYGAAALILDIAGIQRVVTRGRWPGGAR